MDIVPLSSVVSYVVRYHRWHCETYHRTSTTGKFSVTMYWSSNTTITLTSNSTEKDSQRVDGQVNSRGNSMYSGMPSFRVTSPSTSCRFWISVASRAVPSGYAAPINKQQTKCDDCGNMAQNSPQISLRLWMTPTYYCKNACEKLKHKHFTTRRLTGTVDAWVYTY